MYFVNRKEIEARLVSIDELIEDIENKRTFESKMEQLALERASHLIIEAILDVGNSMIDGFIMRDPGSYHDIIDILLDEEVIPKDDERAYKSLIDLRQMLVQEYLSIDHEKISNVLFENLSIYQAFSQHIRSYLTNELGVANAFSKDD